MATAGVSLLERQRRYQDAVERLQMLLGGWVGGCVRGWVGAWVGPWVRAWVRGRAGGVMNHGWMGVVGMDCLGPWRLGTWAAARPRSSGGRGRLLWMACRPPILPWNLF
jgi:hypothetical protein